MNIKNNKRNNKATKEHVESSTYIKNVHKKLRHNVQQHGWEESWSKHIQDTELLNKYATYMENLSCKHWTHNQQKENSKAQSRINWVHKQCQNYFDKGIFKNREQEIEIAEKCNWESRKENILETPEKLKLLDVGSCYNPFKQFDNYEVTAIDIAPSNKDVIKCDFLNVTISRINENTDSCSLNHNNQSEKLFIERSYHVIIFSLLLDYFPDPELRMKCCKNAYDLLKYEGILLIISPDAKHVGANAKFMKSWRWILATLGFRRIVYEKLPYLHCMVFRKCTNLNVAKRWANLHEECKVYDKMYVPQDFNESANKD